MMAVCAGFQVGYGVTSGLGKRAAGELLESAEGRYRALTPSPKRRASAISTTNVATHTTRAP